MAPRNRASLASVLTQKSLRRLAGERSFERGRDYCADDLVRSLRFDGETIAATVAGTEAYRVKLWAEEGDLAYSCSCPFGQEGAFCKHCVAAGLA